MPFANLLPVGCTNRDLGNRAFLPSHSNTSNFLKRNSGEISGTGWYEETLSDLWKALLNDNQSLFYTTLDWFRTIRINRNILESKKEFE